MTQIIRVSETCTEFWARLHDTFFYRYIHLQNKTDNSLVALSAQENEVGTEVKLTQAFAGF